MVVIQLCFQVHKLQQSVLCYLHCPPRNGRGRERASLVDDDLTYMILLSAISIKNIEASLDLLQLANFCHVLAATKPIF